MLNLMRNRCAQIGLAACTSVAATATTHAAAFVIDDTVESFITLGANDWEGGLFIDGGFFQSGISNPANTTFAGETFTFDGTWIDLGQTTPLTRTVYFVNPGNPSLISDILSYTLSTDGSGFGNFVGAFTSSPEGSDLGTVPSGTDPANIWEEGSGDFVFGAPFFGGRVKTVPTPGAATLLGLGGIAALRRRRRA